MDSAGEPIPISALQHAVYCLRQAALIHLERLWAENRFTAEGDVLHAVVDKGGNTSYVRAIDLAKADSHVDELARHLRLIAPRHVHVPALPG